MAHSIEYEICTEFLDQGKDIPIGSLVKYILECFPDSCFSTNWGKDNDFRWADELIIVNAYEVFRYEILDWCGCGCPEMDMCKPRYFEQLRSYEKTNIIATDWFDIQDRYNMYNEFFYKTHPFKE